MEKPYCMYLRKSRADLEAEAHGQGDTLARHKELLLKLANQKNIAVEKIYEEIVSGDTIEARPVMRQLLSDIISGTWQGVLVVELERLARGDTKDQGTVAEAFKYSGTLIITPLKTYDPNNEFDEEYFEFGLFMSRREYKTINRRIQRGRIASVNEGKYISSVAPYGYERIKLQAEKGYSLNIIPEQAKIVRLIFSLYNSGNISMSSIASYLDSLNVAAINQKCWSKSTISGILKNPVYTGKIRWGKRIERKYFENGTIRKKRAENKNYILADGLHEAIISPQEFDKAQTIMSLHCHVPVRNSQRLQNPLAGLVFCQNCGTLMTRLSPSKKTPYASLKCPNKNCHTVSSPLFLIEESVLKALEVWMPDYKVSVSAKKPAKEVQYRNHMEKQIKEITLQKHTVCELFEKGIYSPDLFSDRMKKLDFRLSALSSLYNPDKTSLQKSLPEQMYIRDIYNSLETVEKKNRLLKILIKKIIYKKTEKNHRGSLENANYRLDIFPIVPNYRQPEPDNVYPHS